MKGFKIGVHVSGTTAVQLVDGIVAAEAAGIDCAWLTSGGIAADPLATFAAAAMRTENIAFGTSILPTFPRHPLATAQGALTVDALAPGRLRLGIGPSHKPSVEATYGIPFERPLQHLREYLTILRTLFETGEVSFGCDAHGIRSPGERLSRVWRTGRWRDLLGLSVALSARCRRPGDT